MGLTKVSVHEVFSFLEYFTAFRGSNGIQVVPRRSLYFGTQGNQHYDASFHFFKYGLSRHNPGRAPQIFVVNLDQLVLEFSCSRQRRPENAISILKKQVVCGFTAARQGSSHKREILHAVWRS